MVSLHELGHAHLLLHTNSQADLMYYQLFANDIGVNDADASRFIVNRSNSSSGGDCRPALIPVPTTNCRTSSKDISEQHFHFSAYPNPAQSNITIDIPNYTYEEIKVSVVNAQGQVIYAQNRFTNQIFLETDSWAKGLYCINIVKGDKITTQKILKQ